MNLEKPKVNARSEECKRNLDEAKLQLKDYEARVGKAKGKAERIRELRRIALAENNHAHAVKDAAMASRERAERLREEQSQTVAEFTQLASAVSAHRVHIEEGETHQSIEHKYDTHLKMLKKRLQQAGASEEDINNEALAATNAYKQAKEMLITQQQEQNITKQNLEYRKDMWRQFQRHISARTRVNFQYLLSERGFRGRLELDHPNKKLSCRIEPDETRKSAAGRSTKTLSGGEKSFSSICMLLAIWEAMGSPLRCLDEFDVFMDNVNRAMSTNMLV
jgi:chromosome segregation ATPase